MSRFLVDQVFDWVYRKRVYDPENWSNISKTNRALFKQGFEFKLPKIIWHGASKDGTHKFLMGLDDKRTVETVLIPMKNHYTVCLSSQVGCAIGCTFCHTGTQGFTRHLEAGEIIGQYVAIQDWGKENLDDSRPIQNIVYMGQGEPLHNFENVGHSLEIFMEPKGLGLGQRKITVSTSGLVPQIEKLELFPPVNLAISLHAVRDDIRSELMPINKVYDLKRLFKAINSVHLKGHRFITFEYICIDNMNMEESDLQGLMNLLDRKTSKVNLIPFNEYPGSPFKKPSRERIENFNKKLLSHGYVSTIRSTKGDDILAACGQLKSESEKPNLWADA